jgi:hypothetical protein
MKEYYSNDYYFNDIIDKYFKQNNGWMKILHRNEKCNSTNCNDLAFHHRERQLCSTCTVSNGFIDTSSLGNKKKMYENMLIWNKTHGHKSHNISYLPITYSFINTEFHNGSLKNKLSGIFGGKYWIIKPEYGMRQEGITIIKSYSELKNAINKYPVYKAWVIQEYIHKPLLYKNKKYHFRIYAIILKSHTVFETYLYPKGYMYIADDEYNINDLNNPDRHITSSCNNKEFPVEYDKYYGKNEFNNILMPQIRKMVHDTTDATYKYMMCANVGKGKLCYKMIAYDIIPDSNKKLYLMEVNARVIGMSSEDLPGNCKSKNPSLQTVEFKTELMTNILNTVLKNNTNDIIFEKVLQKHLNSNTNFTLLQKYYLIILFIILFILFKIIKN